MFFPIFNKVSLGLTILIKEVGNEQMGSVYLDTVFGDNLGIGIYISLVKFRFSARLSALGRGGFGRGSA
jgi:hypothetical protein